MLELEPISRISDEQLLQALSLSLAAKGRMVRLLRMLGEHTQHEEVRRALSDLIRSEREHIMRIKALLRAMPACEDVAPDGSYHGAEASEPEFVSII